MGQMPRVGYASAFDGLGSTPARIRPDTPERTVRRAMRLSLLLPVRMSSFGSGTGSSRELCPSARVAYHSFSLELADLLFGQVERRLQDVSGIAATIRTCAMQPAW